MTDKRNPLDPWTMLVHAQRTVEADEEVAQASRQVRDAQALTLIDAGCRLSDICSALGITRSTASRMIARARTARE